MKTQKIEPKKTKWEGKKAPAFKLSDQNGKIHTLADYTGKTFLLYFYPKDMTPGCTTEAQGFRDLAQEYKKHHLLVLGVNADTVSSHKKFCEKESLNFTILSDENKKILEKYGVWKEKTMYGKKYMGIMRESFLVGPNGRILKHYQKVNPIEHPAEVLRDVSGNL
jgi:peroxiredoxin Q/BCP